MQKALLLKVTNTAKTTNSFDQTNSKRAILMHNRRKESEQKQKNRPHTRSYMTSLCTPEPLEQHHIRAGGIILSGQDQNTEE